MLFEILLAMLRSYSSPYCQFFWRGLPSIYLCMYVTSWFAARDITRCKWRRGVI